MAATKKSGVKVKLKVLIQRDRAKDLRLQREYNLTLAQYNTILEFQNHACAICKRPQSTMRVALSVDHCHKTGLVRGLLCMACNRALGKFQDSITKLKSATAYLMNEPATAALGVEVISAPGRVGTKKRAKTINRSKQARDRAEME